jgi:DNA-binding NtrC family response regulator
LQLSSPLVSGGQATAPADPWESFDWSGGLPEVTRRALAEVERRKIRRVLDEARGDRSRTAELLQVPMRFLQAKLREYRIE